MIPGHIITSLHESYDLIVSILSFPDYLYRSNRTAGFLNGGLPRLAPQQNYAPLETRHVHDGVSFPVNRVARSAGERDS
jgi:hypothetical protein